MTGMSRETGAALDRDAHIAQSVADILSTPIGSRVMRRSYGSRLFDLIDAPMNDVTRVDVFAAVAEAIATWEPRLKLVRVSVDSAEAGALQIAMVAQTDTGTTTITTEVRSAA